MATTAATLARWLAAAALTRAPVGRPRVAACAVGAAHLAAYMRAASLSTTAMVPPAVVAAAAGDGGRALKGLPGTTSSVIRLVEERGTKFYVDKAAFIPALERAGRVITLVRPQRWGKSMFMNLLEAYYDCARVSKPLVHVPGGNTAGANKFTILRFDLMGIAKAAEGATTEHDANAKVGAALDDLVVRAVEAFIARYEVPAGILTAPMDPMSCLQAVCAWAKQRGTPVYVMVDEYDAPLRHTTDYGGSHLAVSVATGPVRHFYTQFKVLMNGGFISRIFMTGTFGIALHRVYNQ